MSTEARGYIPHDRIGVDDAELEAIDKARRAEIERDRLGEVEELRWLLSGPKGARIVVRVVMRSGALTWIDSNDPRDIARIDAARATGQRWLILIHQHDDLLPLWAQAVVNNRDL